MKASVLLFFNRVLSWKILALLLGLIFISLTVPAQIVSQEKFPTYDTQEDIGSNWINANSVYADDNDFAYNELKVATSNTLNTYDYLFSIPSGATIRGIKVSMGRFGTSGSQVKDAIVRLHLSGHIIGENKAVTTETWNENEIETLKEYGGETDLWGTNLTVEDINYGHLGLDIAVSSANYGSNIRAFIDYVKITIYYTPLDPSYCAGAAVVLLHSANTLNAANSLGAPDGAVAKLVDNTSYIVLDLTGEVTPRPQGGKLKIRLRDPNPDDGASWLYYRYATTRSESSILWTIPEYYQVNSTTLYDAEIPVAANTRYLMLEVVPYFNLPIEIDAVTYDCPCSGPTITTVTANPPVICNGSQTTLSVTGNLCGADHWAWYKNGCGQTPIGTGETINYMPYPGTYIFYVRAEGGSVGTEGTCGSVSVTVNEWPLASITGGEQNACVSTTLRATTNVASASYIWYKGDVAIESATNSTLTVTETGSYKVKITNTATGCARTSDPFTVISVSTMPANKTVSTDQTTVCPGARVNFRITNSESGVYYRLRNDKDDSYIGGAVSGINGVNIYLTAENLTETTTFNVISSKGYCLLEMADKPTVTVGIIEPAITKVEATPASICQGSSSTLSVTGNLGSATAWKWYTGSCGGTLVGTGASISVSPTEATTYYVRGEGGCATSTVCSEVTVTVNPSYTPYVTISSDDADNKICYAKQVIFTATPHDTGGGTVSYKWILNGTVYDVWDENLWVHNELVNGDQVSCQMTVTGGSCLSQSIVTSNIITMVVYDPSPLLSVDIISNDADNKICDGTEVIFKATPANTGGGEVSYQWKYNGNPLGPNSNTYASTELSNGDKVSCEITVSYPGCSSSATATSNEIITKVITNVEATITSDDADDIICAGTTVTFTATPFNYLDGTINYMWFLNGQEIGNNQSTFTTSALKDGDEVTCGVILTGGTCPTDAPTVSNTIKITVLPPQEPWVTIASSDADNSICAGTSVTFTATKSYVSAGTLTYHWLLNGSSVGTDQDSYTLTTLKDGDRVLCIISITGHPCLAEWEAISNEIQTTVITPPTPFVTIASNDANNSICAGTSVTFTATKENVYAGSLTYHWLLNGFSVGTDQDSYTLTTLKDGDRVLCKINVTGIPCLAEGEAISNEIQTTVITPSIPSVTIFSSDTDNNICTGTSVTFTATLANTGEGIIAYQWKVNGINMGSDQNTYVSANPANGDLVSCQITITGGTCLTTPSATSNGISLTVTQCCTPGVDDMFEPNNSLAKATFITVDAPEILANILNAKDQDWFAFKTTKAGYYTISNNLNGGNELVELYNARAQKLRSGTKTGLTYDLLAKTTYYIKIYDAKLKSPSPCYTLDVDFSTLMPAGGFIEENMALKEAEIAPVTDEFIKIWPNPTSKAFELYNGNEIQVNVQVMDAIGRTIERIDRVGSGQTILFGSKYTPGIYFVKIFENETQATYKLVKR